MTVSVTVSHTFEAGHRLAHLPGKCQSLHGHSWRVEVTVAAPEVAHDGTIVMFGDLKRELREWIDTYLDHGLILGGADPLALTLWPEGKVFVLDREGDELSKLGRLRRTKSVAEGLYWPTVENIATMLARVTAKILPTVTPVDAAYVARVTVSETATNSATWEA